nr:hypothetical protein [uncultured Acetobacterium sp.]
MFEFCEKCRKKHKEKASECKYPEVDQFISLINRQERKNYILEDCPDENNTNEYSVDLHYKDVVSQENLWIEVKEVILSMTDPETKGKNNGQVLIEKSINSVLGELTTEEYSMLDDYNLTIPFEQFGDKDTVQFERSVSLWLKEFFDGKHEEKLCYKRKNNREINIYLKVKSQNETAPGYGLVYVKEVQPKDNIGDNFSACTDLKLIEKLIEKNIKKTEETKNKYPTNEKHRILLNILRLPSGMEIFWNAEFERGFENDIRSLFENKKISKTDNITECYFAYFMKDYFKMRPNPNPNSSQVFICYPIIKGIINEPYKFEFDVGNY